MYQGTCNDGLGRKETHSLTRWELKGSSILILPTVSLSVCRRVSFEMVYVIRKFFWSNSCPPGSLDRPDITTISGSNLTAEANWKNIMRTIVIQTSCPYLSLCIHNCLCLVSYVLVCYLQKSHETRRIVERSQKWNGWNDPDLVEAWRPSVLAKLWTANNTKPYIHTRRPYPVNVACSCFLHATLSGLGIWCYKHCC